MPTWQTCTLNFNRGTAGGILGQELVPPMGMVEVGEERPGNSEASSASNGPRLSNDDQEKYTVK